MPLRLTGLPPPYREPARRVCRRLRSTYPSTTCLVVIGSVAMGSNEPDSDLDLVWVYRGRLRRRWYEEVGAYDDPVVELVPLNLGQVRRHFRQHSPLAHAIQHGLALYDPDSRLAAWRGQALGVPTAEWIEETYQFMWGRFEWGMDSYRRERGFHRSDGHGADGCTCQVSEILTRAVLNLVRLLMVLDGEVSLCKAHTRQLYPALLRGARLRQAMETTLRAHHERRDLDLAEAGQVAYLGAWARRKLVGRLGAPEGADRRRGSRRHRQ